MQAVFAYYGLNAMLLTLDSNAFWVTIDNSSNTAIRLRGQGRS